MGFSEHRFGQAALYHTYREPQSTTAEDEDAVRWAATRISPQPKTLFQLVLMRSSLKMPLAES